MGIPVTSEKWRPVGPDYPGFEVSNQGRVRSRKKVLTPAVTHQGYKLVCLSVRGKPNTKYVGHLVAAAFRGPRPPGMVTRRRNGAAGDDRAENLFWGPIPRGNNRGTRRSWVKSREPKLSIAAEALLRAGLTTIEASEVLGVRQYTLWRKAKDNGWPLAGRGPRRRGSYTGGCSGGSSRNYRA